MAPVLRHIRSPSLGIGTLHDTRHTRPYIPATHTQPRIQFHMFHIRDTNCATPTQPSTNDRCYRRGYNTRHTRTDDHQADIFLTFPFAQHTRSGIPTRFDELLLSYQNRPVLTHQDILDDNDTNMNIRRPVEILIQRCGTSPMTSPLNTSTHRR